MATVKCRMALPTPEEIERLEAAGWAPSRLGAGWYVRGASEPTWWTWVLLAALEPPGDLAGLGRRQ